MRRWRMRRRRGKRKVHITLLRRIELPRRWRWHRSISMDFTTVGGGGGSGGGRRCGGGGGTRCPRKSGD